MSNAVKIYDTTLRDGTQGEGISFSVTDKLLIAQKLDHFGVDYIEGGFPGSNPRDITFFQEAKKLKLKHARLAAFGATRRAGAKAEDDAQLRTLLESGMPVLTIVGKTWTLHVTEILRTTLEENLAMIEDSTRYLVAQGREVIYDAEHFFDGFKADPDYALKTLAAAMRGGASNLSLCDTNGGTLVDEFKDIVARAVKEFGGEKVGVHCHNDSGLGVALSIGGVAAGATLVQGTMNGYGERVGNVFHLASWLNPAINFAETFSPPGSIVRIDGSQLSPTVATGIDYSLRMELFENKLNLNFIYYTTEEVNNTIPQDGPGFFNTLYDANIIGDRSGTGRNIRGMGRLPNQYRDTRTRSGSGYEIEVTFNPTRALRFTGNIGFPRLFEANAYPDVRAYIDKNAAIFKQIANDAGVIIGADNVARVDDSIPINSQSSDAASARDAYNNIYSFRKNIVDGKRLQQDQPVANFFGDYTLQGGRLKGLRVGAGARYRGHQIFWSRVEDTIPDPNNPRVAIDDPKVDAYTPAYSPDTYVIVTGTMAYTWRFKNRRELQANLVINNLLNDRGPAYSSTAQSAHVMRPLNNDYTSPARETVPRYHALKQPLSWTLTFTTRL